MSDAVARAAADPFKLDWVIGLSADQVPGETLDKKKLYADMVAAYITRLASQWLGFIASVKIDPFGDLGRTQRILLKLTAEKSELAVLLATVADYTVLKKESVADKAGGAVLDAASKVPAGRRWPHRRPRRRTRRTRPKARLRSPWGRSRRSMTLTPRSIPCGRSRVPPAAR